MIHLKLTIAYDGTGLAGWQRQSNGTSVQALIEDALAPLNGGPVVVSGAGRTDAGVHAIGQVASVTLHRHIDPSSVVLAANQKLPPAVRVLTAAEVGDGFHARFDAVAKTYRYRIWNSPVLSPFERAFAWHIAWPVLDVEAMREAAIRLAGRHDFASFECSGGERETTVRTIHSSNLLASMAPLREPLITYEVRGDGFLRHMVRSIVGTLVEVGTGRRDARWVDDVLQARERSRAGRTAPAAGLFLVSVEYGDSPSVNL